MNYCNQKVSKMLQTAQFTPDPVKRAGILNRAEAIMAADVPSVPMFVRPGFLINNRKVSGTIINPTNQGSTWNVQTWKVSAS
jgi:ABC-type transport system substrate-binding protein